MSFDLDKFIKRPSFYFLASQAVLFMLALISGNLIGIYFYKIKDISSYQINFLINFNTFKILQFLIPYSFITIVLSKILKKPQILFNKVYLLVHFILFLSLYFYGFKHDIVETHGLFLLLIYVGFLCSLIVIILFVLCTLIPYIVLLFKDKKHLHWVESISYYKNPIFLRIIFWSTIIFVIYTIFGFFFHIATLSSFAHFG